MEYNLNYRKVIELSGEDCVKFLQDIFTNDINIQENSCVYALLLSPQGRVLYDFFVYKLDNCYLLDSSAKHIVDIVKKLTIYKLRKKIDIKVRDDLYISISNQKNQKFIVSLNDPRIQNEVFRNIGDINSTNQNDEEFYNNYRLLLIDKLIPEADFDFIPDDFFALELRFDEIGAIDFKKGCYVGQEVTARTKYRGNVRKKLSKYKGSDTIDSAGNCNMHILIDNQLLEFSGNRQYKADITKEGKKVGVFLGCFGNEGLCLWMS